MEEEGKEEKQVRVSEGGESEEEVKGVVKEAREGS